MHQKRPNLYQIRLSIPLILLLIIMLAACSPVTGDSVPTTPRGQFTRQGKLTPYQLSTPDAAAMPTLLASPTFEVPALTPTPRTHTVKRGEDMGGIAYTYRVSLEALMAANPGVSPNLMSVGAILIIPPSKTSQPETTQSPGDEAPVPTAVPLETGELACRRVEDGGVWCFLPVHNNQESTLEGVTAVIRLAGAQPEPVLSQFTFSLIDTLPAGASLPLVTYFPPAQVAGLTPPYAYTAEIQSVLPNADDGRYLPVRLEQQKIVISSNGLAAAVSVLASLTLTDGGASRLWVAAVAYDAQGNVVGVRRWENTAGSPLKGSQPLAISFSVYSTAGAIHRVELFAEARP